MYQNFHLVGSLAIAPEEKKRRVRNTDFQYVFDDLAFI